MAPETKTASLSDPEAELRAFALKEAFGSHAPEFEKVLNEIAAANFEAYKYKVKALEPVYAKRAALAKKVPHFWFTALNNCQAFTPFIDPVDREALSFLEDVSIEHDKKDPRDFKISFTFSSQNIYFKEKVLTKSLTTSVPASETDFPAAQPHDLEAPLFSVPVPITWTTPGHDLTKKAPRADAKALEEFDEFSGMGSWFGWFGEDGRDVTELGESLLEWYSHALEYAAGMAGHEDDMLSEDEDDDESDDDESDDDAGEVDLESEPEERPKKKNKKA